MTFQLRPNKIWDISRMCRIVCDIQWTTV